MAITRLCFSDYRNIGKMELFPTPGINLLYGNNGQGKTNLLEGIWLFTGMPSFRDAKLKECVAFTAENAVLEMESENTYLQRAKLIFGTEKKFTFNGVRYPTLKKCAGYFRCVVFAPNHLYLFHDGPKARRDLLDQMIAQLQPDYASHLSNYENMITGRNAILRDYRDRMDGPALLAAWDSELSKLGTWITVYRKEYVGYLSQYIGKIYDGLSDGKESLKISYRSTVFDEMELDGYRNEYVELYGKALSEHQKEDFITGHTGVGVHRDDLEFTLNGLPVKNYGSQGQKRSVIIALKIAESEMIGRLTGQKPVILLDDVMSELDVSRQNFILNHLENQQVFITCCDPVNTLRLKAGKIFQIHAGNLEEERQAGEDVSALG